MKLRLPGMPTVLSPLLELYFSIIFFIYIYVFKKDFHCIINTDSFYVYFNFKQERYFIHSRSYVEFTEKNEISEAEIAERKRVKEKADKRAKKLRLEDKVNAEKLRKQEIERVDAKEKLRLEAKAGAKRLRLEDKAGAKEIREATMQLNFETKKSCEVLAA